MFAVRSPNGSVSHRFSAVREDERFRFGSYVSGSFRVSRFVSRTTLDFCSYGNHGPFNLDPFRFIEFDDSPMNNGDFPWRRRLGFGLSWPPGSTVEVETLRQQTNLLMIHLAQQCPLTSGTL